MDKTELRKDIKIKSNKDLENKITKKTKGIINMHYGGFPNKINEIKIVKNPNHFHNGHLEISFTMLYFLYEITCKIINAKIITNENWCPLMNSMVFSISKSRKIYFSIE